MFHVGDKVKLKSGNLRGNHYHSSLYSLIGTIKSITTRTIWNDHDGSYAEVLFDGYSEVGVWLTDMEHADKVLDRYIMPDGKKRRFSAISTTRLQKIIKELTDDKDNWQRHKLVSLEKELAKRHPIE